MSKVKILTREIRVRISQRDQERLDVLCTRLEMTPSEVFRWSIRQAHSALGERVELVGPQQTTFLPTVNVDGKTPFALPIPKIPEKAP